MSDYDVMHLPAEYLPDGEAVTQCEETVGPGEHTENVDDATCIDCLRASILPALAQGRREGAEEERSRIVAWMTAGDVPSLCRLLAAAIEGERHLPEAPDVC